MRIETGYTLYFCLHRTVSIVNPKSMSVGLYSHGTNVQNVRLYTAHSVAAAVCVPENMCCHQKMDIKLI